MAIIQFRKPGGHKSPVVNNRLQDDSDYDDPLLQYEETDEENERRNSLDYDDTADRRRRKKLLRLLLIFVLIVIIAAGLFLMIRNRNYSSAVYTKVTNIDTLTSATYVNLGGSILTYSRDGAGCMDENGNKIWNLTYEMQQPIISVNGDVAAIGDYNGSTIYIVNREKQLGTINTNMPIRNLCASSSGEVAAVLDDTDVTWVYLYDSEGSTIAYFKTTMKQSGYPIAVGVSPGGEIVGISFLQAGNSEISSSVAFYNFGAVGQNALENNVSGYNFDNEIFPYIYYMNEDTMIAVSDQRIAFFEGKEIPQNESTGLFQDTLVGVYCGSQYAALLFPDTTGEEEYDLQIYNTEGTKVGDIRFSMDYTEIVVTDQRIIIHNDSKAIIASPTGEIKYEGIFENKVRIVVPTESTARYTLVTETSIERMILQ